MTTQYFRITAYHPVENLSVIFDSNGMFEKLWQFSSFLLQKGFKILEASSDEKFLDINITKAGPDPESLLLRAHTKGRPENLDYNINGTGYYAIQVEDKIYIADKNKTL